MIDEEIYKLYNQYENMIYKISINYYYRYFKNIKDCYYTLEDVKSIGKEGFFKGINTYNKNNKDTKTITYLYICIENQLKAELKSFDMKKRKVNGPLISLQTPILSDEEDMFEALVGEKDIKYNNIEMKSIYNEFIENNRMLKKEDKKVIYKTLNGESCNKIAKQLHCADSTVWHKIRRWRESLENKYDQDEIREMIYA